MNNSVEILATVRIDIIKPFGFHYPYTTDGSGQAADTSAQSRCYAIKNGMTFRYPPFQIWWRYQNEQREFRKYLMNPV